jgi:hypothetical protein
MNPRDLSAGIAIAVAAAAAINAWHRNSAEFIGRALVIDGDTILQIENLG